MVMRRSHFRFVVIASVLSCVVCVSPRRAHAEPDADAIKRADQLFSDGKSSLSAGEVSAACEMFAASYALDPATGSLLALAMCHEREGKFASAVREYRQIVDAADDRTRPDRLEAARARIAALTPRLSTLTIELDPQSAGSTVEVRLNGELVPPEQLGRAIPIDAGSLLVTASAPHAQTFVSKLNVAGEGRSHAVRVSSLQPVPTPRPIATIPIVRPVTVEADALPSGEPGSPLRSQAGLTITDWSGIALVTTGVVALGAGGMLALRRIHEKNVRNSGCTRSGCVDDPPDSGLRLQGVDKASLIGGAVLTLAGVSLLVWQQRYRRERSTATAAFAAPWFVPNAGGAVLHGRF